MLQVKVNGKDFHTFPHRMPLQSVCAMHIAGDVSIQTINVIGVRPAGPSEALSFMLCWGGGDITQTEN